MDQSTQQYRVSFMDYPWSSPQDIYDYYDLRYLFDDDEIFESKQQLIEDADKVFWHTYDNEEDEYFNLEGPEAAMYNWNVNIDVEEENWDEDEDWGVRFQYGIGFYDDGYDSGYDEPFSKREPYPAWYDTD